MKYLCLLRGINVGGKNKISMAELKTCLESAGFSNVSTYINSGNVFVESDLKNEEAVEKKIETLLPRSFTLDSELIKIRAISLNNLRAIVEKAPKGFGQEPELYHSDVLFPMAISSQEVMAATDPSPEVDAAWESNGVVYYRRLSAKRTKSRLNRIMGKPVYKSITIRSWNTTIKLLALLEA
jgi:uncharacterized protein (DUF1697 family)